MLFKFKLSCLAFVMVTMALPLSSLHAEPKKNLKEARTQAIRHLDMALFRIKMFHHQAKSSLTSSLELPVFKEYFELEETTKNTFNGHQLSDAQNSLRQRMEEWVLNLHSQFLIGETCLIDSYGQEHLRVVGGDVKKPIDFSNEEASSPFFKPSFATDVGEVYVSEPYMSPDSYQWVTAFTSPIMTDKGKKEAVFHIEIPLEIYHQIVLTKSYGFLSKVKENTDFAEEGRFFIVDHNGFLIADTRGRIDFQIKRERHPLQNLNLPDYLPPEKFENYAPQVSTISDNTDFLSSVNKMHAGKSGVDLFEIDGQPYILAYAPIPDRPWSIAHLDPIGASGFWDKK